MVRDIATTLGLGVCAGVVVVLGVVSALGVFVGRDDDGTGPQRGGLISSLSAGVVLTVSWLHLLDDAQETLQDLTDYPAANCAMLVGFLLMWLCHVQPRCHHHKTSWGGEEMLLPSESAGSCTAQIVSKAPSSPDAARVTRFHVMEASISFHSFLIGLGIGFADSGWRAQLVLGGSLCVHQFFEGCAVGSVARQCQLSEASWRWTFLIFSLSLPSGAAFAIAAQLLAMDGSNEGSQWALGLLTACAASQPRSVAPNPNPNTSPSPNPSPSPSPSPSPNPSFLGHCAYTVGLHLSPEQDPKTHWQSAPAGTLTHIGVEMISHEMDDCTEPQDFTFSLARWGLKKPLSCPRATMKVVAICIGAAIMAVLAIWA